MTAGDGAMLVRAAGSPLVRAARATIPAPDRRDAGRHVRVRGTDAASATAQTTPEAATPDHGTDVAMPDADAAMPDDRTRRARDFVAAHRAEADALGRRLADLVGDPDALVAATAAGLDALADPAFAEGQRRIAPGIDAVHGVRWPLLAAVGRGFRSGTRRDRATPLLQVADRLVRAPTMEERWLAFGILERTLAADPERSWQLLRGAAREAGDWITVDTLAHPYGRGMLLEAYRWAEIEQLVYSRSRWERRLVGSTIATIPFVDRRSGRAPAVAGHALGILGEAIGDDEPDVQRALAWALRSLTLVDRAAVRAFCEREAAIARERADGARAWVVRDALTKLEPADADRLRSLLAGIRRRPGAASTSRAAAAAAAFARGGLPDPSPSSQRRLP